MTATATMGLRDPRSYVAGAWLAERIIVGVEWLRASWHEIGNAGWTETPRGAAVEGYLQAAIAKAEEEIAFPAVQG